VTDGPTPLVTADRPFVIGLTGNIACGKSTVVSFLTDLGAVAIDADAVYHELIAPGQPLWHALVDRYGVSVLAADNTIDRRSLGRKVFADPATLAELERLTHPAVVAAIRERMKDIAQGVVVIDAVKLIESGLDADCDQVWLVHCEAEQQIDRLMRRNGFTREEAAQRVAAQTSIEPKLNRAAVIIDNSGAKADTRRQVEQAWLTSVDYEPASPAGGVKSTSAGSTSPASGSEA
jgi:dephospho-CoA kinase